MKDLSVRGNALITKTKCLLLVEDHHWFRQAFAMYLDQKPDLRVVDQAASLAEGLDSRLDLVDVAVVDLDLPGGDGLELVRRLRETAPNVSCVVLAANPDAGLPDRALQAGAVAVLAKSSSLDEIVEAVRRIGKTGEDRSFQRASHRPS